MFLPLEENPQRNLQTSQMEACEGSFLPQSRPSLSCSVVNVEQNICVTQNSQKNVKI